MSNSQKVRENKIKELIEKEDLINRQLQDILYQRNHIDVKLNTVSKLFSKIEQTRRSGQEIANTVNNTAELSDSITAKIHQLDIARARVFDCQTRLNDLIDLRLCSDGVLLAMKNEEYEQAAGHIHRFLSMNQLMLQQTASDISANTNSITNAVTTLQNACTKLHQIVKAKFDEAVSKGDLASIERYFKLFPLLNLHEDGLSKFSLYLCSKIYETSTKNIEKALETSQHDKRAHIIYADILTLLFEGVARIIEIHSPLLETYYQTGRLLSVILIIQKECDRQTRKIYNEFVKRRQIVKTMTQINDYLKNSSITKLNNDKLDPKSLDVLITELSIMHSRAEMYCRFLSRRVLTDLESALPEISAGKADVFKQMLKTSELSQCMHELISNYLLFEQFFLEESVKKAISLDTPEEGQQTSSMVDDVFFILRKCVRRSISSGSLDAICAMINNVCGILENHYCSILRENLRQGYPSGYLDLTQAYSVLQTSIQQGRIQSGNDLDQSRLSFITHLNNTSVSCEYVDTLCTALMEEVVKSMPQITSNDREKLESCISGLSAVTTNLKSIEDYGMEQLRSSAIKPRVNQWLDEFLNVPHEITEDELSEYEAKETFIQTLIMHLEHLLNSFRNVLTTSNFDTLVGILSADVTARFEKVIFQSKFNRLGGLILDKEIRALTTYLTSATSWSIRDKFTRLIQIATILNMERVTEISEYEQLSGENFSWRLTPVELRQIVSLRTDFTPDELNKFKI
ncbi:conserved oligomeric Golgi complex subunit 4 [Chrysoperla carnea]|uniref:conserved oligomeric Golgi complex subunit 4 n=1 Tax=Chrysoperla carnea TaxID=189513 RepID=UPI001D06DEC3|nr:conserved oligomeric Golgi complex subunit 4 [Chrysoperla carnea]